MDKEQVLNISNNQVNEAFRKFYWYDNLHHINNRIVKAQEYLLEEYNKGLIKLQDIKDMHDDYDKLVDYFKPFGYQSEYEYKDLRNTHHIVIDYIQKTGS